MSKQIKNETRSRYSSQLLVVSGSREIVQEIQPEIGIESIRIWLLEAKFTHIRP